MDDISRAKKFYVTPTKQPEIHEQFRSESQITNSKIKEPENKIPHATITTPTPIIITPKMSNAEKLRRLSVERQKRSKTKGPVDPAPVATPAKKESNIEKLKRLSLKRKMAQKSKEGNKEKLKRLSMNTKPRIVRQSPRTKTPKEGS